MRRIIARSASMKTIAQVVEEYRNRQNPVYEYLTVLSDNSRSKQYEAPSNIKLASENDGWLEFDTVADANYRGETQRAVARHMKIKGGEIIETCEILEGLTFIYKSP